MPKTRTRIALAVMFLSIMIIIAVVVQGCASKPPQPMGENIWKAVPRS